VKDYEMRHLITKEGNGCPVALGADCVVPS